MIINQYTAIASIPPETDIFYDDFNDNSLDGSKWTRLNNAAGFAYNEVNQQMEVDITGGTNAVDALVTVNSFDFTDRALQVEAVNILNVAGAASYFVAIDSGGDFFGFNKQFGSNLNAEYNVASSSNFSPVTYDGTNHRYLRLRHSSLHDALYWEASPDALTWTNIRTVSPVPAGIDLTSLKFRLQCNFNTGTTQKQVWDKVRFYDVTPPVWDFADIPFVISRYRASDIVASDGDPIGTVPDLIGSNDGTSAGSDRPLWRAGGGTPYLEFNASDVDTGITNTFGSFTVIVVADLFAMTAAKRVLDKNFASGFWMGINPANTAQIGSGILEAGSPYGAFHTYTNGNRYALLVARDVPNSTAHNWLNASHASRAIGTSNLNSDSLTIGAEVGGGGNGTFNLYEMLVVGGMISSGNMAEINSYLTAEYGVSF